MLLLLEPLKVRVRCVRKKKLGNRVNKYFRLFKNHYHQKSKDTRSNYGRFLKLNVKVLVYVKSSSYIKIAKEYLSPTEWPLLLLFVKIAFFVYNVCVVSYMCRNFVLYCSMYC